MTASSTVRPKALAFDVFGTVVDWYGSIVGEVDALAAARGVAIDGPAFARAWRAGYQPAMQKVRTGELPWLKIDALHRLILDGLVERFGLGGLTDDERNDLNRVWHRLAPWPDSVAGLTALKSRYTITTLSNGNVSLLTAMARHGGLPWDCVISAELFHHYKPDPESYLGCAALLDVAPEDLMLVAAHPDDLKAAAACGLRTAYVARPLEHGPGTVLPTVAPGTFDFAAPDLVALAAMLA